MTSRVSSSARAQRTENDFGGLKQRSKPATGALPDLLGSDPTGSPLTGSEHDQHVPKVLLAHLRAGIDALSAVNIGETGTKKHPGGVPDSA